MAEQHPEHFERMKHEETHENKVEQTQQYNEETLTTQEKEHGSEKHISQAVAEAERHAISNAEISPNNHEKSAQHHPVFHGLREKEMAWTRSITRTRKKLSFVSKSFSKVAHSPVVDSSSEFIGKTVARPSSVLGGALFAFLGSSVLLWATRHYGYEYNYLVFFILFVLGAFIGLIVEGVIKVVRK